MGDSAGIKAAWRIALIPDGLNLIRLQFSLMGTIRRPTVLVALFLWPPDMFQDDARKHALGKVTSDDLPIATPQALNDLTG